MLRGAHGALTPSRRRRSWPAGSRGRTLRRPKALRPQLAAFEMKHKTDVKTDIMTTLAWDHAIKDVPDGGMTGQRDAAPDELSALAQALDLIACTRLQAQYAIQPAGGGRYRLSGRLHAEVTQACVVTLDPVESTLE